MATPRKVREGAALAETLIARAADGNTPTGNPPEPAPAAPELTVVTDVPPAPPTGSLPGVNPYAIAPSGAPAPAAPAPSMAPGQNDGWEHKYHVLKGMFDTQRKQDVDSIHQLQDQINALVRMGESPPTTIQDTFHPQVQPQPSDYGMTEDEIEALGGPEFVESIRKISAAGYEPTIQALTSEITNLRKGQAENAEDAFYSQLGQLSPNWAAINKDPRFEEWLLEGEGLSGIPRRNFLTNAYDDRDADTAARYFNSFAALLPSPPSQDPNVLQDIIPGNSGGGSHLPSGGQQNATIYSPKTITQFFKDRGLGKFKGREDVAAAIEADIFAAQKEGRIRREAPA